MSYLPTKPFIPTVSRVPNLGASSGNPAALRDPHSTASIGSKLQEMTDQSNADRLYDAPVPKTEGFRTDDRQSMPTILLTGGLATAGLVLVYLSLTLR